MKALLWMAGALVALASPAIAQQQRVCEGVLRGQAGEHAIQILLEDGEPVMGLAIWRPTNQTAVAGSAFPAISMYYRVLDLGTGQRGPLFHVQVIHVARIGDSRATSAEVRIRAYGETDWAESRDWASFADSRRDAERDDIQSMAGSVGFGSPAALELFSTALQVESHAVTNENVRISAGIWNLSYRVALDPLFDRAYQEARRRLSNPAECVRANAQHAPLLGLARDAREGPQAGIR